MSTANPSTHTSPNSGAPSSGAPHACPFCAMHCDGFSEQIRMCARGAEGFAQAAAVAAQHEPAIGGKAASLDEAIARTAGLLKEAWSPLLAGFACDVAAVQSALRIAETTGAVTDHANFEWRLRNLRTVQEHGAIMTTFSEVRNRADLVVLVGPDPLRGWPCVGDRMLSTEHAMFLEDGRREFVRIGPSRDERGSAAQRKLVDSIDCGEEALIDLLGVMSMRLRTKPGRALPAGIRAGAAADRLLDRIRKAKYPVFIWDASRMDARWATELCNRLFQFVVRLNDTQRAAALAVGGNDGEASSEAVHLWTTGFPSRIRHGGRAVQYDPLRHSAVSMLARGDADLLMWIASLDAQVLPPAKGVHVGKAASAIPAIVIGHPGLRDTARERLGRDPEVFIPVGVPGVHHPAQMFRGDRIVVQPLRVPDNGALPRASSVLGRIADAIGAVPWPPEAQSSDRARQHQGEEH